MESVTASHFVVLNIASYTSLISTKDQINDNLAPLISYAHIYPTFFRQLLDIAAFSRGIVDEFRTLFLLILYTLPIILRLFGTPLSEEKKEISLFH